MGQSVTFTQCCRSGTGWIRVKSRQAGSGSVFGIRILKVKLRYKHPLFQQIFHNLHIFERIIKFKSSLFSKRPIFSLKTKNIYRTFLVENKSLSKNLVFVFVKMCLLLGSGSASQSSVLYRPVKF
jgi:hypothetical protein